MLLWTSEAIRITPALCMDVKAFSEDVTLGIVVDGMQMLEDIHLSPSQARELAKALIEGAAQSRAM